MKRRDFLSLIAAAPIAALAPLPRVLPAFRTTLSAATGPTSILITSGGSGFMWSPSEVAERHLRGRPTLSALADYARSIEREVARETLGCDSLEEYLTGPDAGTNL